MCHRRWEDRPLALRQSVPLLVPRDPRSKHLGSRTHPCLKRQVCLSRRSLARQSRHLSVGAAFQMSLVGIILSQSTAPRPCRPMGTAMGRREIPPPPADELPGRDDPMHGSGTGGGGGPNPPDLIRLNPGTMNLARSRSTMRPLKARMLASLCITCSEEPVTRPRWRRGGTGPGQGAFFILIRLTLLRMPSLLLCGKGYQRMSFSSCWTMLQQLIVVSANTTGISCQRPFCLTRR